MKNRIITAAAFAAYLALCAAVWPQNQPAETPVLPMPAVVIAAQPEVSKMPETEEIISPEEEKAEAILLELIEEADIAPEPLPAQMPRRVKCRLPSLNTGCNTHKNQSLPRHLTAHRITWSMCQASAG